MATKSVATVLALFMVIAVVICLPQRGTSSLSINEAQNILVGNTVGSSNQDCVCMNWRRCADVNSDVECHPNYVYVCCRRALY